MKQIYHNRYTRSRYNIESDEWIDLAPMSEARMDHASTVILGKILVIGGHGELSSVECYNLTENTWTALAPMIRSRSGFDVGTINGFVYVMGGSIDYNAIETVISIERYSMESNTWTLVSRNVYLNNREKKCILRSY